jgi:hypothetical protein
MNKVDYILKSSLSHQDRLEIKKLQRPTPDLQIEDVSTSKKRTFHRHFNRNIYDKYSWICGCEIRNKLFCFVCLVMGYGESSAWTKSGVSNLKHLADRLKKHTVNETHLHNILDFNVLGKTSGKTDIRIQLDNAYRENIRRHNEKVDQNRHILRQLINCIRFCGAFELALRGHDETIQSQNRGIFLEFVDFVTELDGAMKEQIVRYYAPGLQRRNKKSNTIIIV